MRSRKTRNQRGFSLVELLAVVLVLAVLAGVAIPLYTSQRKSAAGRACKASQAAIISAANGYALRNNANPPALANLVGAAEGLTSIPACPLTGAYTYAVATGVGTLTCPNSAAHAGYGGTLAAEWIRTLPVPAADSLP